MDRFLAFAANLTEPHTVAANLLRRAAVLPPESRPRTTAGRRWLRAYLNGCAFKVRS
jgi:hypothetical protein